MESPESSKEDEEDELTELENRSSVDGEVDWSFFKSRFNEN